MREIINKIEQLTKADSPTQCKSLLKEFLKDEEFYYFLKEFYEADKFNVGKKMIEKAINFDGNYKYKNIGELVFTQKYTPNFISTRNFIECLKILKNTSGNILIETLKNTFCIYNASSNRLLANYITGNLQIGISLKTVNKILVELNLPKYKVFEVMLCERLEDDKLDTVKFPCEGNTKYDGLRIVAFKHSKEVILKTRAGEIANNYLPEIVKELEKIDMDFILDGEVIGKDFPQIQKRIGRKTENITESLDIKYVVFDILKYGETDICNESRKKRIEYLLDFIEDNCLSLDRIQNTTWLIIKSIEQLKEYYKKTVEAGEEGIIIKDLESKYEFGSRKGWWKVKPFLENTFKVIGYNYGTGKNFNVVGSLIVVDKDEKIKVNVGSGMSDERRDYFNMRILSMSEEVIRALCIFVDVKYQEVTSSKKGHSLRFPSILKVRIDKTEADKVL